MKPERPIAIAIILFIIFILVLFLVWPQYEDFRKLRADLGEKKAQYNAQKDYYAEITKKYYELQNRQTDLKKIDDALPEEPDFGKIAYYFHKTATDSGMLVKNLLLANKTDSSTVKSQDSSMPISDLSFSIDLLGSYSSLGRFLVFLEKSDRIFEVTSISFSTQNSEQFPTGANPSGDQLQTQQIYIFNLQVKTHSY